jgi:hypothetical protein
VNYTSNGNNISLTCFILYEAVNFNFTQTASVETFYPAQELSITNAGTTRIFAYDATPDGYPAIPTTSALACSSIPDYPCYTATIQEVSASSYLCEVLAPNSTVLYNCVVSPPGGGASDTTITLLCDITVPNFENRPQTAVLQCTAIFAYGTNGVPIPDGFIISGTVESAFETVQAINESYSFLNNQSQFECQGTFNQYTNYTCARTYTNPATSLTNGMGVTCVPTDVTGNYTGQEYMPRRSQDVSIFLCSGTVHNQIPVNYEYACTPTPGQTVSTSIIQFATPGHGPVETSSNVSDSYVFFVPTFILLAPVNQSLCTSAIYFNCSAPNYTCDCSDNIIASLQPPAPLNNPVYWVIRVEPEIGLFQPIDNRCIDEDIGWRIQGTDIDTIERDSIVDPVYSDEFSEMREIERQDNEFVQGSSHDFALNPYWSPYQRFCDGGCPQPFSEDAIGFGCFVDGLATPQSAGADYGINVFPGIKEVIEAIFASKHGGPAVCLNSTYPTILVRNTIGYYTVSQDSSSRYNDQIYLGDEHNNMYMASLPGEMASFLGNIIFCGDATNITFRGIRFLSLNGNNNPVIGPAGSCSGNNAGYMTLLNNFFEGAGSTGGGVFQSTLYSSLTFRYNTIHNFVTDSVFFDGDFIDISYNAFITCTGNVIDVTVSNGYWFISNALVECRGGSGNDGANIVAFTAAQDDTCAGASDQNTCYLIEDIFNTAATDTDMGDTCMLISQGSINITTVYDIAMSKCQYGFVSIDTNIDPTGGRLFFHNNPLVRPAEDYLPDIDPTLVGNDLVIQTSLYRILLNDLPLITSSACNFPCSTMDTNKFLAGQLNCTVNNNYDVETMPPCNYSDIVSTDCYRYGYYQYHNGTNAGVYCNDTQLAGVPVYIFFSNLNGSRLRHDNITIDHNSILDGSDNTSFCRIPNYRPVIEGVGNQVACNYTVWYWLEFWLSESIVGLNMWSTGTFLPQIIKLYNIIFDGRSLIPETSSTAFYMTFGVSFTTIVGPPLINETEPYVNAGLIMDNCSFINFTSYSPTIVSPEESRQISNVITTNFPYTNAMYLSFINVINATTFVNITNSYFENIDSQALAIYYAQHVVVDNCTFINVTGRAYGNWAGIYITAPQYQDANGSFPTCNFTNNFVWQYKPTLYHFDASLAFPGHVFAVFIHGYPCNSTICVTNVTINGTLDGGLRFAYDNCSSIVSCLNNDNPPFFPDDLRDLRSIALNNNSISGTWSDIVDCQPPQDLCGQCLICDGVCPVVPPTVCYVDLHDPLFINKNPWNGIYLFNDTQTAVDKCQLPSRTIVLIGTQDLFGQFTTIPFKSYPPFDLQIPEFSGNASTADFVANCTGLNATGNCTQGVKAWFTGPVTIQGSDGMEIYGCDNRVNNTWSFGVNFVGLTFRDSHTCVGTWNQPANYESVNLAFLGNLWNGNGSSQFTLTGIYDNEFTFDDNIAINYTGDYGVRVTARNCQVSTYVEGNTFVGYPGACLELLQVGSYFTDGNSFNCGGQATAPGYAVWMNPCGAGNPTAAGVRFCEFSGNSATATFTTTDLACNWTSYFFSPLPIPNLLYDPSLFESNTTLCIQAITDNSASGLEDGARFNHLPPNNSPPEDCRRLLRFFAVTQGNRNIKGIYHDIIDNTCAQDPAVGADPLAYYCYYCDDGCFVDHYSSLAAFLFWLAAILGGIIVCAVMCCSCCSREIAFEYDAYLGIALPDSIFYFPTFVTDPYNGRPIRYNSPDPVPRGDNLGSAAPPSRFYDAGDKSAVVPLVGETIEEIAETLILADSRQPFNGAEQYVSMRKRIQPKKQQMGQQST